MWYVIGFIIVILIAIWLLAVAVSSLPVLLISIAGLFGTFFSLLHMKVRRLGSRSVLVRYLEADCVDDRISWNIRDKELDNNSDSFLLAGLSLVVGGIAGWAMTEQFVRKGNAIKLTISGKASSASVLETYIVLGIVLVGCIYLLKPQALIRKTLRKKVIGIVNGFDTELSGFKRLNQVSEKVRTISSSWGFPFNQDYTGPIRSFVRGRSAVLINGLSELNNVIKNELANAEADAKNLETAYDHYMAVKTYYSITSKDVIRSNSIYLIKEMETLSKRLESDKLKSLVQNKEWDSLFMNLDILKTDIKRVSNLAQKYQESNGSWVENEIDEDGAFNILGIPHSASDEQIKVIYKRLALIYHPDIGLVKDESRMKKINAAFEYIKLRRGFS